MSYEKKKLAGVGNTHLYQYQTPGLMEQDHPDVYPMRMNPMQQYPCPMQPPPQQTHTMNPADQCLSTPQPPSQTNDMVDNGSCMAAVSRVVMEDPMQEPTDNLGLDEAYRTGETAVQQPTLEMPIRAEVVMEPDPNEDEAEPDGEDDVEKSRISSKKHCFVCNTQLPEDIETAVPFFKTETTKTNKKFSAVITKLVGRSITPRKAHSEIICRRCFNLLDRIDTLEVELRDSKDEVISMYKTTLDIYGGKTRRKRTVVSRKSPFLYSKNTKVGRTSAVKSPKIEKQETIEAQVPTTTQAVENVVDTGVPTTSYEQSCSSMPKGLEMDDDIDDMEDLDDSKKTEEEGSKDTAQKKRNRKFKGHMSAEQRASVIRLKEKGWTFPRIAKKLGFCPSTTKRVWKQYKLEGKYEKRKRIKHHRVTTPEEDKAIFALIKMFPSKTAKEVKTELNLLATTTTVMRRMREIRGIKVVRKANNPKVAKQPRKSKPKKEQQPQINHIPMGMPIPPMADDSNQSREFSMAQLTQHTAPNAPPAPHPTHMPNMYRPENPPFGVDFYKEVRDMSGYRVNNESYFQREAKPMPYYNDSSTSVILPQWYQQFYQHQ